MKKPELVAPAGDLEKLKTALLYGADAVYASTPQFSMRTREIGFDYKTLHEGVKYTHNLGKKIYFTLNIYPYAREINDLKKHINKLVKMKPDALIVADIGVIDYLRQITKIPIHLSTQANTTNYLAANFYEKLGLKRLVLARELNLKDIKLIHKNCQIPLEVFVHGAMCMSYSGRCQISNYFIGRDPNKGQCIQPCRYKYKLYGIEEEKRKGEIFPIYEDDFGTHLFNSRDLCMIEYIPELINAGVSAFKIEGRMKGSFYVGSVVRSYRQAIDLFFQNPQKYQLQKKKFFCELTKTSNRGFTTGFYLQKPDKDTNNYLSAKETSDYSFVGVVKDYDSNTNEATIEVRNFLPSGSILEILTLNKIIKHKLSEIIYKGKKIPTAHANYFIKINISDHLKPGFLIRIKNPLTDR